MKKFLDAVSCWDNYAGSSRYGWVEEIEDPQMSARLRSLSPEDLELLTRYEGDLFRSLRYLENTAPGGHIRQLEYVS
jgi:hypothetical protein